MQSVQISKGKRQRRKRTDDQGRTFTCRCGKSYLSYPALYTHIKTKHSDQPLSKLQRNFDVQESSFQVGQKQQNVQPQRQKQKEQTKEKQKQQTREKDKQKDRQYEENYPLYGNSLPEVNNIEVLREFLFKYFPNIVVNVSQNYKNEMTPQQRKELKEMREYWEGTRKKEDQPFNQFFETPIKFVLGKFILQLQHQVHNSSFKKFLSQFVFLLKKALDKIKDENYFTKHNASELPLFFDEILRSHLLVDSNDFLSNPTVSARTLYHLGRWLYVNKFTNLSLKYNF